MIPELQLDRRTESERKMLVQTLPHLEKGVNLVEAERGMPVLQILLASELSTGEAVWIDQEDKASTFQMARAGGRDILSRVQVSRSYTPYQHYNAVMKADRVLDEDTEILVMPSINLLYEDGQLREKEREDLFKQVMRRIKTYAEGYDLKVMASLSGKVTGELEFDIRAEADKTIEVEETDHGLRFDSGDFSSRIYRSDGKIQTNIPLYMDSGFTEEVKIIGKDEQNLQAAPGAVL